VVQVDNLEGVNENGINICFTTIQQLHTDMTTQKENALTNENFAEQQIVLLADEAHHINVSTKSQQGMQLFENRHWHVIPDLDGEIYLKNVTPVKHFTDISGHGVVNILDLVVMENAFGEQQPDLNRDRVVNILDLVIVANNF